MIIHTMNAGTRSFAHYSAVELILRQLLCPLCSFLLIITADIKGKKKHTHTHDVPEDSQRSIDPGMSKSNEDGSNAQKKTPQDDRIPRKRPRQQSISNDVSTHSPPLAPFIKDTNETDKRDLIGRSEKTSRWGPSKNKQQETDKKGTDHDNTDGNVDNSTSQPTDVVKPPVMTTDKESDEVEPIDDEDSPSVDRVDEDDGSVYTMDEVTMKNGDDTSYKIAEGIGFSKPTFTRFSVKSDRPLGITASNTDNLDPSIKLPFWVITRVKQETQAEELGIKAGNVIFSIGGKGVTTKEENLVSLMKNAQKSGDQYEMVVCHDSSKSKSEPTMNIDDDDPNDEQVIIDDKDPLIDKDIITNDNSSHTTDNLTNRESRDTFEHERLDRSPQDKMEQPTPHPVKEENAILPSPSGRKYMQLYDVHLECKRRTKRICVNLCLLPPNNSVTLSDAINLVFASLNYEAPNSCYDPKGSARPWMRGLKIKLVGPQLWMATRKFVAQRVQEMLEAEGLDWIECTERREHLKTRYMPLIHEFLSTWRPILSDKSQADTLEKYGDNVWKRFTIDHLSGGKDVLKFHKLTEKYVHFVAGKLEARKMCPSVPKSASGEEDDFATSTQNLKAMVMKYVRKIKYEVIPFAQDLDVVSTAVWERLQSNFVKIQAKHISSLSVRDVLDDLEDDSNFLSIQNGLYRVRVSMSVLRSNCEEISIHDEVDETREISKSVGSSCLSPLPNRAYKIDDSDMSTLTDASHKHETYNPGKKDSDDEFFDNDDDDDDPLSKRSWEYSSTKEMGARVYAEFTNGEYYWGHIGNVVTPRGSNTRKFFVQFEDGDFLDDVPENKVYSETEYKKYFEMDPPPPPKETDQEKRWRRRVRNMKSDSKADDRREKKKRKRSQNDSALSYSDSRYLARSLKAETEDKEISLAPNSHASHSDDGRKQKEKQKSTVSNSTCSIKEGQLLDERVTKKGLLDIQENKHMSPRMLRKIRCKKCTLCKKRDCGQCMTCLRNSRDPSRSSKEVCLRKMCCKIPTEVKAQPAVGFPAGWTFTFCDTRKASFRGVVHPPSMTGLSIIAPNGRKYHSVEAAKIHNKASVGDIDTVSQQFLAHIGVASYELDPNHFLVGKGYCHEWTDIKGRTNILFGVITSCSKDSKGGDDVMFTVEYSKESASFVNSISNSFGCPVPSAQLIPSALAWGGCVAFERKHKSRRGHSSVVRNIDKTMSCKSWITPDMRIEEMVDNGDGLKLPKLTITFRGFKLVFSVKKSTKPNAGYGLFVQCSSLLNEIDTGSSEPSFLNAGELLDLGIYAPFRASDKKHECIFKLKNYIYSQVCEDWCFNAMEDDHQYDITDDLSGEVHSLAKQHVLMYVNECGVNEIPTIHAEFDPEGSVHYLLGVSYNGSWDEYEEGLKEMNIKAGGNEVEVFVNYGNEYERARLRKGYSTLVGEEKERALEEMKAYENEFVGDIKEYTLEESTRCVNFFNETFSKKNLQKHQVQKVEGMVKNRCLAVLDLLKSRIDVLIEEEGKEVHSSNIQQTVCSLIENMKELRNNDSAVTN